MKQSITLDQLIVFLEGESFFLTDLQRDLLKQYQNLLTMYAGRMNLVSKGDSEHLVERHFLPCLWLCSCLSGIPLSRMLDIGTGAGLPGIIVQIMFPDMQIVLLESIRKKAVFLKTVCDDLAIGANVVCERAESYYKTNMAYFDAVSARAVATIDRLWPWSQPILKSSGILMAMKGDNSQSEISWLQKQRLSYRELVSPESWRSFSPYMKTKRILIVENKTNR